MHPKSIKLPISNVNKYFVLNEAAINVIRNAQYLQVSYSKVVSGDNYIKCGIYFRAAEQEIETFIPINVENNTFNSFSSRVYFGKERNPLQVLVKRDDIVLFTPTSIEHSKFGIVNDIIYWTILRGKHDIISDVFSSSIRGVDALAKMIV